MFKITRSYFYMRRVFSFFSWSLIYVFDISFSSNEFFLHRFRQTTRISFIFYSRLRQSYEFDKLIDEHVNYLSLDNENFFWLRTLCLIFFFEIQSVSQLERRKDFVDNSKEKKISLTTRKKRRFHWH
jgi:hypothetical protein